MTPSVALSERADARAELLCNSGQWSHNGFAESFKGLPYRFGGENLARGFTSLESMHKALLASPAHKKNIQDNRFTNLGVGRGSCGIVVELFGGY